MNAAGEILASEHAKTILSHCGKAKVPLGQPDRSFEEGSTTDGCKHGTLQACRELQTQEEAAIPEGGS